MTDTRDSWITCEDCGGSGRDTAGHNFAYTGERYACENCDGQGGYERGEITAFGDVVEQLTDIEHLGPGRIAA